MSTIDAVDLMILNLNFFNTNWANARIESGKLVADFNGELFYTTDGETLKYEGVTTCEIRPQSILYTEIRDTGFDQSGYVSKNLDFCPLNQVFNF